MSRQSKSNGVCTKITNKQSLGDMRFNTTVAKRNLNNRKAAEQLAEEHPELQGRTDIYNVLGGMDVAKRIQPGEKKIGYDWSDPYSLSGLAGLYALYDSSSNPDQSFKEGFADWFRNMKGIGIQRDVNPLGLLYDDDEADYYTGYYNKIHKDYQKMQADRWQKEKLRELKDVVRGPKPGDGGWSPSGADLSPGGGRGQSPTGRDIAGTPFSEGGLATMFERRR